MNSRNRLSSDKELKKVEDICVRESPPACVAKCPVHVDARGIAEAVGNGDFAGAYKLFSASVPFTRIISETCGQVCERVCLRRDLGGGVHIGALERACVDFGYKKSVLNKAFLPKKSEKTAVIGGGLSGLTAAYYLKRKGYSVDIYEKTAALGGKLKEMLDEDVIQNDISILLELGVNVIYNSEITALSDIEKRYNAVYIATGSGTFDSFGFDANEIDGKTLYLKENLFAGGSGRTNDYDSIFSLSDGKSAATSIERYLQKVSMTVGREKEGSHETVLFTNTDGIVPESTVAAEGKRFTKDKAKQEAARCIDCRCDECVKGCTFLSHYKTNPKKFIREVRNCLQISVGSRFANEAINSCSQCGFCAAVCPVGLDTGSVCMDARKKMAETGKMPPSAHDFALRDMAHSNGGDCFLARHQNGHTQSKYLLFPGCQLGATAPETVEKTYADLCERLEGGVGLMLGCCGAIAKWAAREELFEETLNEIKRIWEELGKPDVIAACPTCFAIFTESIPEMSVSGIWEVFERIGLPKAERKPMKLAVHDACTTRGNEEIHKSVRRLLSEMGVEAVEPAYSGELTQCCGYGGLTGFTNRELSDKTAYARTEQSEHDFAAYCVNCRDRFMDNGKKAYHFLELAYGGCGGEIKSYGWSDRRRNREQLKRALLERVWGEKMEEEKGFELYLDENVGELIEKRMILLSDIKSVVGNAEETGKKLRDNKTGSFIAAGKSGEVTFWVWYSQAKGGYAIHKAYSHRMEIEGM